MSLEVITDPRKFAPLYQKLASCFSGGQKRCQRVGIQKATWDLEVLWFPKLQLWAHFNPRWRDPATWPDAAQVAAGCIFGAADLSVTTPSSCVPITCQMNFPMEFWDASFGGRFLKDAVGGLHVAHTGKVNKVKKDDVLRQYPDKTRLIQATPAEAQKRPLIYLGPLDTNLPSEVAAFVKWVGTIK